jgi:hypothetical protein
MGCTFSAARNIYKESRRSEGARDTGGEKVEYHGLQTLNCTRVLLKARKKGRCTGSWLPFFPRSAPAFSEQQGGLI